MKLYYIANVRLPTEKAHGIQIMKMCEALSRQGAEITLVIPARSNHIKEDPFKFYGVEPIFAIKRLPVIDIPLKSSTAFIFQGISFYISLLFYLLFKKRDILLYTRGEVSLMLVKLVPRRPFVWETHIKPDDMRRYRGVLKRALALVTVTEHYANELTGSYGVPAEKVLAAPDGVDLEEFATDLDKQACRERLGLPDAKIALYAGHLYGWKGADTLAEAADHFEDGELAVFVGGTEEDLADFRKRHGHRKRLLVLGHKPRRDMKYYLKAADVLVLPNSAKSPVSRFYTSPLKLFEYMASRVPVVASDLASFREVLSDDTARFFTPDDPVDLTRAIRDLFARPEEGRRLAERAFEEVERHTWTARSRRILDRINRLLP